MADLFLDTSFAIALAASTDRHHARAQDLATQLERDKTRLVTTAAVLLEIGNALARPRYRSAAVALLAALESDPQVEVIPLSPSLYRRGFDLYRQRSDKSWGLTDCISFVVMSERSLGEALSADEHFEQAGFRALLLRT